MRTADEQSNNILAAGKIAFPWTEWSNNPVLLVLMMLPCMTTCVLFATVNEWRRWGKVGVIQIRSLCSKRMDHRIGRFVARFIRFCNMACAFVPWNANALTDAWVSDEKCAFNNGTIARGERMEFLCAWLNVSDICVLIHLNNRIEMHLLDETLSEAFKILMEPDAGSACPQCDLFACKATVYELYEYALIVALNSIGSPRIVPVPCSWIVSTETSLRCVANFITASCASPLGAVSELERPSWFAALPWRIIEFDTNVCLHNRICIIPASARTYPSADASRVLQWPSAESILDISNIKEERSSSVRFIPPRQHPRMWVSNVRWNMVTQIKADEQAVSTHTLLPLSAKVYEIRPLATLAIVPVPRKLLSEYAHRVAYSALEIPTPTPQLLSMSFTTDTQLSTNISTMRCCGSM